MVDQNQFFSSLLIQFLSIGPYLCSTLPADPTSR